MKLNHQTRKEEISVIHDSGYDSNTSSHRKSTHEQISFQCNECNFKSTAETRLSMHIQMKHPVQVNVRKASNFGQESNNETNAIEEIQTHDAMLNTPVKSNITTQIHAKRQWIVNTPTKYPYIRSQWNDNASYNKSQKHKHKKRTSYQYFILVKLQTPAFVWNLLQNFRLNMVFPPSRFIFKNINKPSLNERLIFGLHLKMKVPRRFKKTVNKVSQSSEKPKQSENSLVNLGGIYLCPYDPELRTNQIDQSEER